jgi:hypothetical protein
VLDLLTTVFEVLGLLCLSAAAAVAVWVFSPALGFAAAGVVLILSSFALVKLGGSR